MLETELYSNAVILNFHALLPLFMLYHRFGTNQDHHKIHLIMHFGLQISTEIANKRNKPEHRKNMRNNFFIVRVTEQWSNLPREFVECPSLEIFQAYLDAFLCNLLQGTALARGDDFDDLQRSLSANKLGDTVSRFAVFLLLF